MKKLFYLLSLFMLMPALVSAEVEHTRSFTDQSDPSSIVVNIAATDYDKDINCGGLAFWGIQAIEHETGNRFFGSPRFVSSDVLSQTFTLDLPLGDFEEMTFICSDNGENEAFQFGSIENDLADDQVIFEVTDDVVLVVPEVLEANASATSTPSAPTIIDIIDSGAITNTATDTATSTLAPVIQDNGDGSTTLIAI